MVWYASLQCYLHGTQLQVCCQILLPANSTVQHYTQFIIAHCYSFVFATIQSETVFEDKLHGALLLTHNNKGNNSV